MPADSPRRRRRGPSSAATVAALIALLAAAAVSPARALVPVKSRGIFTDREGTKHTWYVNGAHTLFWDDKPFVPVGGAFEAKSWSPNATELDFGDDLAALKALKAKGVTDLYVRPAKGGLTGAKPEAVQRLIDALDAEGFTYGISIADGPREPLIGHLVRPGAYRQVVPEEGGNLRFPATNLAGALYFVVSAAGDVFDQGDAALVSEGARVTVQAPGGSGQRVVFVVPEAISLPGMSSSVAPGLGMCNLWEGFDGYRDTLIGLFSQVKLGKGFRFFVDALPPDLGFSDSFEHFVPSGPSFADEWAAWLGKRYKTVENLYSAWSLSERDVPDFKAAAGLIPLWSGGKGIGFYYDRAGGKMKKADAVRSAFWRDLNAFKAESVRGYMDDLAVVLKKAVADVPVVYRTHGWSPLMANLPPSRGFDGFGVEAYGRGSELATRTTAYVYAQASEAPKTIWLPVIATADAPTPGSKAEPGYSSRFALHSDLDWMREIGARGFYVDGFHLSDPKRQPFDLLAAGAGAEQVGWLKDYADILAAAGVRSSASAAERTPEAVYYPRLQLASLSPVPLKGGAWWLPTDRVGQVFDFGPAGRAYSLDEPGVGVVYYLWNPAGTRRIHLKLPKAATDKNATSRPAWSASAQGEVKGDTLTLTVGPEPIRLLNMPSLPIPQEAFAELMAEAQALVRLAKEQKRMDASRWEQELGLVELRKATPVEAMQQLQDFLGRFRVLMRPYLWLEAENADGGHSFDEVDEVPGASSGRALAVGARPANPDGSNAALANYRLSWSDSKPVTVWVAASPNAPISLRIDGQPLIDEATLPQSIGNTFADGRLVWIKLGVASIPKGQHTLEVRADGPALLDALLFTRDEFKPDGPTPPPVLPPDALLPKKR